MPLNHNNDPYRMEILRVRSGKHTLVVRNSSLIAHKICLKTNKAMLTTGNLGKLPRVSEVIDLE